MSESVVRDLSVAARRGRTLRRFASPVAGAVALGLWELAGRAKLSIYLPPMSTAVRRAYRLVTGPALTADVLPSLGRAAAGLAVGCLLGAIVGIALAFSRIDDWIRPALEFQRALPVVAVVPAALIAFPANSATRIGIIALGTFWPVFINANDGAKGIDKSWVETASAFRHKPASIMVRVVLPGTLPMIFAGARIATSISLLAMVISEFFQATSGLGYLLQNDASTYDFAGMFGVLVILGITGRLMTLIFDALERKALRWYTNQKGLAS